MAKVTKLPERRRAAAGAAPRGVRARCAAILSGRCPCCDRATIFAHGLTMHERCPTCGIAFSREPGYFAGAMYISYALGLPIVFTLATTLRLVFSTWSFECVMAVATLLFLPTVPLLFRYSRILWIHFDRAVDPDG
jgi:uncharacterized protein (DUF983 family)